MSIGLLKGGLEGEGVGVVDGEGVGPGGEKGYWKFVSTGEEEVVKPFDVSCACLLFSKERGD